MKQKFRPSLTATDISHLISLCKRDGSSHSLELAKIFSVFEAKIANGVVGPSHTAAGRLNLADSLGMGVADSEATLRAAFESEKITKELARSSLFAIWCDDPNKLTVEQLRVVQEYRYEENRMTPEEELEYEKQIFGL